jgi:hypothetical protein
VFFLLSGWQSKNALLLILKSAGVAEAALKREPEYALNPMLLVSPHFGGRVWPFPWV